MKKLLLITILLFTFAKQTQAWDSSSECFKFLDAQDYQTAIEAGKRAIKRDPDNSRTYLCLGKAYRMAGKLNLALANLKQAEELTQNETRLAFIYAEMALVYLAMNKADKVLYYYNKGIKSAEKRLVGEREIKIAITSEIAKAYEERKNYGKALEYYGRLSELHKATEDKAEIYRKMATLYSEKGEHSKAIEYLQKANNMTTEEKRSVSLTASMVLMWFLVLLFLLLSR